MQVLIEVVLYSVAVYYILSYLSGKMISSLKALGDKYETNIFLSSFITLILGVTVLLFGLSRRKST